MPLYWPKLLYPYYSPLLFFHSFLSVYRLVLWGWGLRTERVYITLSKPCTADLFLIIIIITHEHLPMCKSKNEIRQKHEERR